MSDKTVIRRQPGDEASGAAEWHGPLRSWNRHDYAFLLAARHHTMLRDEGRVEKFKDAILDVVDAGDMVADLGAGTGILSMFAAQKARKVYAVELFPFLQEFGRETAQRYGFADKITYIRQDARTVTLPEKVDVVICEMIHTGCISEHQIPVMNHALETLLKPSGKVLPTSITTNAQLINTRYSFGGFEFRLPHYESHLEEGWETVFSPEQTLKIFDLTKINPLSASGSITTRISQKGVINSLKITSQVYLTKSKIITYADMTSSLEPIIFPFDDIAVSPGDEAVIDYFYEPGAGAEGFHYDISIKH